MQDPGPFEVVITTRPIIPIDILRANNRLLIVDVEFLAIQVAVGVFVAHRILYIDGLQISRERLLNPHLRHIIAADAIAKIFVPGFVHNDVVPIHISGNHSP